MNNIVEDIKQLLLEGVGDWIINPNIGDNITIQTDNMTVSVSCHKFRMNEGVPKYSPKCTGVLCYQEPSQILINDLPYQLLIDFVNDLLLVDKTTGI